LKYQQTLNNIHRQLPWLGARLAARRPTWMDDLNRSGGAGVRRHDR
jgi:hypothetical protein